MHRVALRQLMPEIAVQQAVPGEVGDPLPVVPQEEPPERIPRGVDGRHRPRVSDELPEKRVDPIQPEEKRESDRDQEVNAHEGGEPDPDAESDRGRDTLRRLFPTEEVGEKDLQPPAEFQPVVATAAERARDLPLHGAAPK